MQYNCAIALAQSLDYIFGKNGKNLVKVDSFTKNNIAYTEITLFDNLGISQVYFSS